VSIFRVHVEKRFQWRLPAKMKDKGASSRKVVRGCHGRATESGNVGTLEDKQYVANMIYKFSYHKKCFFPFIRSAIELIRPEVSFGENVNRKCSYFNRESREA
jgi:hypothetical protein